MKRNQIAEISENAFVKLTSLKVLVLTVLHIIRISSSELPSLRGKCVGKEKLKVFSSE
ncbi:hypothetical protein HHI36_010190, partial [Cryptolaemus montrouzieri]